MKPKSKFKKGDLVKILYELLDGELALVVEVTDENIQNCAWQEPFTYIVHTQKGRKIRFASEDLLKVA